MDHADVRRTECKCSTGALQLTGVHRLARAGQARSSHRRNLDRRSTDLVVEVLRNTTAQRDVTDKFVVYEKYGVREYWILDSQTRNHSFYRHDGELYVGVASDEPMFTSQVLSGFTLQRKWLNPDNLPKVDDCSNESSE